MKKLLRYFSKTEKTLWSVSVTLILCSFFLFDQSNPLGLVASLVGVTSLIFCAKGNPFGQVLMILFGTLYAIISYSFSYYGEMATYLGMTLPMSVFSLVSWLKNPYKGNKSEVTVRKIPKREVIIIFALSVVVSVAFFFILRHFNTANLIPSTISVTTTFIAAALTFRRSPFFALGYAINDLVLIVLWVLASVEDISYISVVICFAVFFANDLYGFISWQKMQKKQQQNL